MLVGSEGTEASKAAAGGGRGGGSPRLPSVTEWWASIFDPLGEEHAEAVRERLIEKQKRVSSDFGPVVKSTESHKADRPARTTSSTTLYP